MSWFNKKISSFTTNLSLFISLDHYSYNNGTALKIHSIPDGFKEKMQAEHKKMVGSLHLLASALHHIMKKVFFKKLWRLLLIWTLKQLPSHLIIEAKKAEVMWSNYCWWHQFFPQISYFQLIGQYKLTVVRTTKKHCHIKYNIQFVSDMHESVVMFTHIHFTQCKKDVLTSWHQNHLCHIKNFLVLLIKNGHLWPSKFTCNVFPLKSICT